MTNIANLDQALRDIWEGLKRKPGSADDLVLEAMRRAYRLAESKEELARALSGNILEPDK